MRVLSWSTGPGGHQELLAGQLAKAGISFHVGAKEKDANAEREGHRPRRGWRAKLEWYRDALRVETRGELIVLSDAWDVVFTGTQEELHAKAPLEGTVLISGEKNCWPDTLRQHEYPMGATPWMFVNSGGIYGWASDLLELLEWGLEHLGPVAAEDDQRFWTSLFLKGQSPNWMLPRVKLDEECKVFQTMFLGVSDEFGVVQEGRFKNLRTGTLPQFLHFNGGANWTERDLLQMGML